MPCFPSVHLLSAAALVTLHGAMAPGALAAPARTAQGPCSPVWQATYSQPLNNGIRALAHFDDGSGPAVYAGGYFTQASGLPAGGIARWDGATWSPLGTGIGGGLLPYVGALAVFDDGSGPALYVGGRFNQAGGIVSPNLAKWDGVNWSAVPGSPDGWVTALEVFDDGAGPALFVGGSFQHAGGLLARGIARFDGASWSSLAGGITGGSWLPVPAVHALAVFDDGTGPRLHAGGDFLSIGGTNAAHVARWNGAQWSSLQGGMLNLNGDYSAVEALVVYDDGQGPALWAGGYFDVTNLGFPNPQVVPGLARWTGTTWSTPPITPGACCVETLAVFDDGSGPALYVGRYGLGRWDGTAWSFVGAPSGPTSATIASLLAVYGPERPELFVGGGFWNTPINWYMARYAGCYPPFTPYCFGDAGTCPCGNTGVHGTGCANSTGAGASLAGTGSASIALDNLVLHAAGTAPQRAALALRASQALNGGAGLSFGDGLRCAGFGLVRLGVRITDAAGGATWGPGLASQAGLSAGQTSRFQVYYRDPVASPCGTGFNLTNALEVTFH